MSPSQAMEENEQLLNVSKPEEDCDVSPRRRKKSLLWCSVLGSHLEWLFLFLMIVTNCGWALTFYTTDRQHTKLSSQICMLNWLISQQDNV